MNSEEPKADIKASSSRRWRNRLVRSRTSRNGSRSPTYLGRACRHVSVRAIIKLWREEVGLPYRIEFAAPLTLTRRAWTKLKIKLQAEEVFSASSSHLLLLTPTRRSLSDGAPSCFDIVSSCIISRRGRVDGRTIQLHQTNDFTASSTSADQGKGGFKARPPEGENTH